MITITIIIVVGFWETTGMLLNATVETMKATIIPLYM